MLEQAAADAGGAESPCGVCWAVAEERSDEGTASTPAGGEAPRVVGRVDCWRWVASGPVGWQLLPPPDTAGAAGVFQGRQATLIVPGAGRAAGGGEATPQHGPGPRCPLSGANGERAQGAAGWVSRRFVQGRRASWCLPASLPYNPSYPCSLLLTPKPVAERSEANGVGVRPTLS